jgi:hypothetical protein
MEPPSRADEGTLVGMGMPACLAETMALLVDSSSSDVSRTCQSSSPALESERTERREESEWTVEFLKRSESESSKSPSSHVSMAEAMDDREAMRPAKLRLGAAIAAWVGAIVGVDVGVAWSRVVCGGVVCRLGRWHTGTRGGWAAGPGKRSSRAALWPSAGSTRDPCKPVTPTAKTRAARIRVRVGRVGIGVCVVVGGRVRIYIGSSSLGTGLGNLGRASPRRRRAASAAWP